MKTPYQMKIKFACTGSKQLRGQPDTQFSNFVTEYLRENEKVCATVFACSYGAHVKSFRRKK